MGQIVSETNEGWFFDLLCPITSHKYLPYVVSGMPRRQNHDRYM